MPDIKMRPTDLGELYTLLSMYQSTYGGVPSGLTEQVEKHYREAARSPCSKERAPVPLVTNPWGAGRKSHTDPEVTSGIVRMRHSGASIRKIAAAFGCSVGHVHKLIHEHT